MARTYSRRALRRDGADPTRSNPEDRALTIMQRKLRNVCRRRLQFR